MVIFQDVASYTKIIFLGFREDFAWCFSFRGTFASTDGSFSRGKAAMTSSCACHRSVKAPRILSGRKVGGQSKARKIPSCPKGALFLLSKTDTCFILATSCGYTRLAKVFLLILWVCPDLPLRTDHGCFGQQVLHILPVLFDVFMIVVSLLFPWSGWGWPFEFVAQGWGPLRDCPRLHEWTRTHQHPGLQAAVEQVRRFLMGCFIFWWGVKRKQRYLCGLASQAYSYPGSVQTKSCSRSMLGSWKYPVKPTLLSWTPDVNLYETNIKPKLKLTTIQD